MSTSIQIYNKVEQLVYERLTSLSERVTELQSETIDPKSLTERWFNKESEFKFLETISDLTNPALARELLFIFKDIAQLLISLDEVREARAQDDVDPLPIHFYEATQSVEELDWVETLFEEELLEGDDSTLLMLCLTTARKIQWLIIDRLYVHHQLKPVIQLVPREMHSEPSVDSRWVGEQRLGAFSSHYSEAWRALDSQENIQHAVDAVLLELQEELDELRDSWLKRCHESGVSCSPALWVTQLSPVAIRWATQHLMTQLIRAISEDVADLFERLATTERPRDHRVGALCFGGERGEDITVVFTKRDGHILAQRQVTWDPERPEEICDAFHEIKIRTLVAPDLAPAHIEDGLERLCERYHVARVSDVATVEVKRPHNLTREAQVALQLAQRYVAPLRYWARADLIELARVSLEPTHFELLTSTANGRALYESVLKGRVDLAWIRLRGLRQSRSAPLNGSVAQPPPPHSSPSSRSKDSGQREPTSVAMRRGELVDVTLTEVSSFRLKGEVSSGPQQGREVLISLSGSRELIERSFIVGQQLRASVIHDHPKQPHAHLTLRALKGSESERAQAQQSPKRSASVGRRSASTQSRVKPKSKLPQPQRSDSETLQTLNSLFKKSSR